MGFEEHLYRCFSVAERLSYVAESLRDSVFFRSALSVS